MTIIDRPYQTEMSTNPAQVERARFSKQGHRNAEQLADDGGSDTSRDDDAAKLADEMRRTVIDVLSGTRLVASDSTLRPKKDENRDDLVSIKNIYTI